MSNNVTAVKINGNQYYMKFTFLSSTEIEDLTGKTIEDVFNNKDNIGLSLLSKIAYVCVLPFNMDLKYKDFQIELSDHFENGGDLKEMMKIVQKVMDESDFLKSVSSNSKTY